MRDIIHFLNVGQGDCTIIQHASGRVTVIDVNNATTRLRESSPAPSRTLNASQSQESGGVSPKGHFNAPKENPVEYIQKHSILRKGEEIFRFILTHPDTDHFGGLDALLTEFPCQNFWDIQNDIQPKGNNADFQRYQTERKSERVRYYTAGDAYAFFAYDDEYKKGKGDNITILAPQEQEELKEGKKSYNDSSYVLLFQPQGRKFIFPGDSEEKTWNFITKTFSKQISNIDVLFAPHHGRKTGGNDDYLKILNPKFDVLGVAKAEYKNYPRAPHVTNNQVGNIVFDIVDGKINVYASYKEFAEAYWAKNHNGDEELQFNQEIGGYFLGEI